MKLQSDEIYYMDAVRRTDGLVKKAVLVSEDCTSSHVSVPLMNLVVLSPVMRAAVEGLCDCQDVCISMPGFRHEILELLAYSLFGNEVRVTSVNVASLNELCGVLRLNCSIWPLAENHQPENPDCGSPCQQMPTATEANSGTQVTEGATARNCYNCNVCEREFHRKCDLTRHVIIHSRVGPKENRYSCEVCRKGFRMKHQLATHMVAHSAERPYSCDQCKKSFKHRNWLHTHVRIRHQSTGKLYWCDQCKKCFIHPSLLRTHMKTHASAQYPCNVCGKLYSSVQNAERHMIVHSDERPYPCDLCDKSFRYKGALKGHMQIHAGEKPFACEECGQSFRLKFDLKRHLLKHTGERPYKCPTCNKGYRWARSLKTHQCSEKAAIEMIFVTTEEKI